MKSVIIEYTSNLGDVESKVRESVSTVPSVEPQYNFVSEEERTLFCCIIKQAAQDYLKGCEEAEYFFFGEGKEDCIRYFDHLNLEYGYFIKLLKEERV